MTTVPAWQVLMNTMQATCQLLLSQVMMGNVGPVGG